MGTSSARFFSDLPIHRTTLSALFADASLFADVPPDWHVIVTDIENSTDAVRAGRHEVVNLIATGGIIAALNLARRSGLTLPFFFGGDGATILVPPVLLEPALAALAAHRRNTRQNFGLELRVGSVPVLDLASASRTLRVGRLHLSDLFSIPVVLGHGLAEAERRVKGLERPTPLTPSDVLDLQGMQCRWDRIGPAVSTHEVVSLLVTTPVEEGQAAVFKRVVDLLDEVYGALDARNPIARSSLRLDGTIAKLTTELKARHGYVTFWDLARAWIGTRLGGAVFLRSSRGKRYLDQLVVLTDTLVIDGRINTVIAGSRQEREHLEARLQEMEREGVITYGLAVSRESVMSCYVSDWTDQHIHFVDGADGGYTLAAGMLKQKVRDRAASA
ncbi:MAG: DUF3095 family protein [Rhodothermales bacterium]